MNLRALIREITAATGSLDPAEVAAKVEASIDDADVRDALRQALRGLVVNTWGLDRIAAASPSSTPDRATLDTTPIAPAPGRGERPTPSARVAAVRDQWAELVALRVCVDGDWRQLGDLTSISIATYVGELRDVAARNGAKADKYEALALALRRHGAAFVRDLPHDVLIDTMGAAS